MEYVSRSSLSQAFATFIESPAFPCVGAKSALAHQGIEFVIGKDIRQGDDDSAIYNALVAQGQGDGVQPDKLRSFVAIFETRLKLTETQFELAMWQRLNAFAQIDIDLGIPWSSTSSSDLNSPDFAMSVGGTSYFVVGLHPGASRPPRAFCRNAIVFNSHAQFDTMRLDGRYQRFQSINRSREFASVGSLNPMLTDHGTASEAPQYSGRQVDNAWICPMLKEANHA